MQELKPDRLAAQLEAGPLAPAWLVAGPEPLLVQEAADAIRAAARAEGITEREVHDADGRDYDWSELSASFPSPSSTASSRRTSGGGSSRYGCPPENPARTARRCSRNSARTRRRTSCCW